MIKRIVVGDITNVTNKRHIILGMNDTLEDLVNRIGRPYVEKLRASLTKPLELGSVLSFRFDQDRNLHMLVCHKIGFGGWKDADKYVRFGLDYLEHAEYNGRDEFSIVQIGTGPIGIRDGAVFHSINTAIANSYLPVTLFVRDTCGLPTPDVDNMPLEMVAYAAWTPGCARPHRSLIIRTVATKRAALEPSGAAERSCALRA